MERIEKIVNEASRQIKAVLLEETRKFKNFPEMMMGIRDEKYADKENDYVEGLFGSVNVRNRGIALSKPGILVYDEDKFWDKNNLVIMLPEGLYRFREALFKTTENGKPINYLKDYPDFESKVEVAEDYITHARIAFNKIRELVAESERRENSWRYDAQ